MLNRHLQNLHLGRQLYQALKANLEFHKTAGAVGIDVGKAKHFAAVLDPVGQTIQAPFSFASDRAGFDHLGDRVSELETRHFINGCVFGFEASGGYEKTTAAYLAEKGHDGGAGELLRGQAAPEWTATQ